MSTAIERARSRRPVTWLTLLGVLLLPAVIGGVLVAALYNPTGRLAEMTAAIVNDDEAVTIDGQLTPLGRQLAAGLVEGSDEIESNLTWVLSNEEDAATGLTDGTYQAVITIPEGFSAAATSSGQSLSGQDTAPEQATITVTTPPDALIVDDAITAQVAQAAASTLGETLSSLTLENVFVGFTTLGDQLGEAAGGAAELADGATSAADGAAQLADGAKAAADGATQLADGAGAAAKGADTLAGGASQLAEGAGALAVGARELATGADSAASGLGTLSEGARTAASGAGALADGIAQAAEGAATAATGTADLSTLAQGVADGTAQTDAAARTAAEGLRALADSCADQGGSDAFCASLAMAADGAEAGVPGAATIAGYSATLADGLASLAASAPQLSGGLDSLASGARDLTGGVTSLAEGAEAAAAGTTALSGGAAQLASGADALNTGATELSAGAGTLARGVGELSSGAGTLATGVGELATGSGDLAEGLGTLASGTTTLADGLTDAAGALPSYTDGEAQTLAEVVSAPVTAEGAGSSLFGASAVPLLAMLALWLGGLASYIVMQASSARALTSRRSSAVLAMRAFVPGAAIGAVQGLLVAGVVQLAADYSGATWWGFAGVAVLAGVAFAAVNQALVAVFGGAGRWIAALVAALAAATGIVSTVPGVLSGVAGMLPTTPAYRAMVGVLTETNGIGGAIAGLLTWSVIALIASTVSVAVRRNASAHAVLSPAAA